MEPPLVFVKLQHFKKISPLLVTGSRGVKFVRKNYPSYILPCKIHKLVILINKFAQCNLCESNFNGLLLFPFTLFLDLDLSARLVPPYRPPY